MADKFVDYLKNNIPNHLKAVTAVAAVGGGIFFYNYVSDLRAQLANKSKEAATLSQVFTPIGTAAISGNQEKSQADLESQAYTAFGSAVADKMKGMGAQVQSFTSIKGKVDSTQSAVTTVGGVPAGENVPVFIMQPQHMDLEEKRPNGIPLANARLFYDPIRTNPKDLQLQWTHYQENFNVSVGDWQVEKTGGLRTTVKLSRSVSHPDPNDPTKTVLVGSEEIPISDSATIYTPKSILAGAVPPPPRWTMSLGISKDGQNGYQPYGVMDYRVTDHYGVFAGSANKSLVGGVSIRLGK